MLVEAHAMPPSIVATVISPQASHPPEKRYNVQEESDQITWQKVKERFWWRKGRFNHRHHAPPTRPKNNHVFKLKASGRCFNCLARDNQVAQCRDPPKWRRCGGNGHISSWCKLKASSGSHQNSASTPHPRPPIKLYT
jgi:hypothetical protein